MKQGTQSWHSRTTQRDEVGREVGVGIQDGGHICTPGLFVSVCGRAHHSVVK